MIISTISYKQLEDRLDAEYYKPDYLDNDDKIQKYGKYKLLGDLLESITNGAEIRTYYNKGIPYLRVSDIKSFFLDFTNVKFIHQESLPKNNTKLKIGDVLLSRSGSIGIAAVATKEVKDAIISSHIIRLAPTAKINPYFLVTFLNSNFGNIQLLRINNGAVVPEINQPALLTVKVPIIDEIQQKQIQKMIECSYEKLLTSSQSYQEAQELLNQYLGIENQEFKFPKTFSLNFSELKNRFDGEFYQPKAIKYKEIIGKYATKVRAIKDVLSEIKYGTSEKVRYTYAGVPFLRVTDVNKYYSIEPNKGKFISRPEADRLRNYKLLLNDLIISRTGTLGSVVHIDRNLAGSIFGSYFIKISLKQSAEILPQFIAIFLNSEIGKFQINNLGSGGIQTNLTIDTIKNLIFPEIDIRKQKQICDIFNQSLSLKKQSIELLEEAKRKVEGMVKKGK